LVEQLICNQWVGSSILSAGTIFNSKLCPPKSMESDTIDLQWNLN
jgi:hypothetical protein